MKNKSVVVLAAAVLSYSLVCMAEAKGTDSTATKVIPTPTWTAAQEKAYHSRLEAYRKVGHKTPPGETTYICAFCGHKSRQKGACPKCGFEMGPYDPKAKAKKKVYSSDSM